jgi:hypothetical protein
MSEPARRRLQAAFLLGLRRARARRRAEAQREMEDRLDELEEAQHRAALAAERLGPRDYRVTLWRDTLDAFALAK